MAAQVFWAVFISAYSQAKSTQQLISTVVPFHPLYFSCDYATLGLNFQKHKNTSAANLLRWRATFGSLFSQKSVFWQEKLKLHVSSLLRLTWFFFRSCENNRHQSASNRNYAIKVKIFCEDNQNLKKKLSSFFWVDKL